MRSTRSRAIRRRALRPPPPEEAIAQDWERRIRALAAEDSMQAADQALEFAEFRTHAARYATIPVGTDWPNEEHQLRATAARI